jgi:hypothetical protein
MLFLGSVLVCHLLSFCCSSPKLSSMSKHPQLFISYAQHNGDAAAALLDVFETAGVTCFLAEKSIAPGAEWDTAIRDAIRQAERVLVLVTPQSKDSVWVAAEVGAAWILGKTVIPALQGVHATDLVGPISKYHGRKVETAQQVAALIKDIGVAQRSKRVARSVSVSSEADKGGQQSKHEEFTEKDTWGKLLKVGHWVFDEVAEVFTGEEMYRYVLSNNIYGPKPFKLNCKVTFLSLRPKNALDAVNAGIVLGWSVPGVARRYYHVAFSGKEAFIELIGSNEGDEYIDYEHLTPSVPFALVENVLYDFEIQADQNRIQVLNSGRKLLDLELPFGPLVGRVGLRPWRSRIKCEKFSVVES